MLERFVEAVKLWFEMPDGVGLGLSLRKSVAIMGPKWFTQRRTLS